MSNVLLSGKKVSFQVLQAEKSGDIDKLMQAQFHDDDINGLLIQTGFADFSNVYSNIEQLEFGQYLCFNYRIDRRKLSNSLLKKQVILVILALQEEMKNITSQGKTFISKERKIEIKEQVKLKLLVSLLPETTEIPIVWDTVTNNIYFFSSNQKDLDSFKAYFSRSMNIGLDYVYKENTDIRYPFNVFLWYSTIHNNTSSDFYINDYIKIQNPKEQITSKKENACQDLATRIINEDFAVNELSFTLGFDDDGYIYTAKADINQFSLRMPKFKKEPGDTDYTTFLVKIDQIKQFMDFFAQMYDSYTIANDNQINEFLAELGE